ncbi:MAG TPA: histone deacetylase [Solirubrobacteraceae bacterium]|nr:histone deacetylase [Solirubrobacteraceae bacterium]
MRFWSHDRHGFPLPPGHRFPLPKYRLLREAVERKGLGEVCASEPAPWELLGAVHAPEYLEAVRTGALGARELRALGLPWSAQLVERGRRSTQGTVEAARDALGGGYGMNLGGGTHHAARAQGRGYCLFNDVGVMVAGLRADGALGRVLVVDCDVHQGDGTAELLAADPDAFTLSLHGGGNYPFRRATSDLDVDLPSGTGDDAYLEALDDALTRAMPAARPDLVVFLAGADPWEGDRLGRLALTKAGLRARDALVLDTAQRVGAPVCVALAGGYAPDVADTVEINLATARAVAARAGAPLAGSGGVAG